MTKICCKVTVILILVKSLLMGIIQVSESPISMIAGIASGIRAL